MDRMVVGESECCGVEVSNLRCSQVRQKVGAVARVLCESCVLDGRPMKSLCASAFLLDSSLCSHARNSSLEMYLPILMHKNATYQSK